MRLSKRLGGFSIRVPLFSDVSVLCYSAMMNESDTPAVAADDRDSNSNETELELADNKESTGGDEDTGYATGLDEENTGCDEDIVRDENEDQKRHYEAEATILRGYEGLLQAQITECKNPKTSKKSAGSITSASREFSSAGVTGHFNPLADIEPLPPTSFADEDVPGAFAVAGPCLPSQPSEMPDNSNGNTDPTRDSSNASLGTSSNSDEIIGVVVEENAQVSIQIISDENVLRRNNGSIELLEGCPIEEPTRRTLEAKVNIALVICILVIGGALILGFVSLGSDNKEYGSDVVDQSVDANEYASTIESFPPFQDDIPAWILKEIKDPTTAAYQANVWLMQDTNLRTYPKERQRQRHDLATLYFATGGDNWTHNDNWLSTEVHECLWFSKEQDVSSNGQQRSICDDEGNYRILNLTANNLKGSSLSEGFWLPKIKIVDLSNNQIGGAPPPAGVNTEMEEFILSNNLFQGLTISGSRGFGAWNIRVIKMDGNKVSGSATTDFINYLPKLEVLNLTGNLYDHQVPSEVGLCPKLSYLGIGNARFRGTLPTELGLVTSLKELDASGSSMIYGTIPTELAQLPNLDRLDVRGTELSGVFPPLYCELGPEQRTFDIFANCSLVECC